MVIRGLVVDDSPQGRRRVLQLSQAIPDLRIVDECATGKEALESIRAFAPDVVFLDAELPDGRGFDLLDRIGPERAPAVIFVTEHERYAVDAFRVNALDFLLKPIRKDDFQRAVDRVRDRSRAGASRTSGSANGRNGHAPSPLRRLAVRHGDRVYFVDADDVLWLATDRNYVRIGTADGMHRLRATLTELEQQLDSSRFLRIHRATIVNLDRVREVRREKGSKYSVETEDGRVHPVSRACRPALLRCF